MSNKQPIVEKALTATRESSEIEFKSEFDHTTRAWCELIKDIMAMANSNGGVIVFGLNDDGIHSGSDVSRIFKIDPAQIVDKIHKYTNVDYSQFELRQETKNSELIVCFLIDPCTVPIIPVRPGEYETEQKEKRSAFHKGVLYYRHGAKSEPGSSEDLAKIIRKNVEAHRREWMQGIKQVVKTTKRSVRHVVNKTVCFSSEITAQPIRVTDNPEAPEFRITDPNKTHPFRMKEFLKRLNEELTCLPKKITVFDIHGLMELYKFNNDIRYTYKPKFSPQLYSNEFASWIKEKVLQDRFFIQTARTRLRRIKRSTPSFASSHNVRA
ncbi:MAG: RNA-binding domain-containing protein [Bdellovibrionales bacterium]